MELMEFGGKPSAVAMRSDHPDRVTRRCLGILAWMLCAYPFAMLSAVYATWLVAWATLGHSPRPVWDDPKTIGNTVDLVYCVAICLMLAAPMALGCCGLGVVFGIWRRVRHREGDPALLTVVALWSWITMCAIWNRDPGRVLYWFFD